MNTLQKENNLQKEELEKEITLRHTLQLQLESKNQLIATLTNECNHVIRKNSTAQLQIQQKQQQHHHHQQQQQQRHQHQQQQLAQQQQLQQQQQQIASSLPRRSCSPSKQKFKIHIQVSLLGFKSKKKWANFNQISNKNKFLTKYIG